MKEIIANTLASLFMTGIDALSKIGKVSAEDLAEGRSLFIARIQNVDLEEVATAGRLWRLAKGIES